MRSLRNLLVGLGAGLLLLPSVAHAWWSDDWSLRKPVTIDTGATGANITEAIGRTPVLVRLHAGNFKFGAGKPDGSDLRVIAGDDKTPLKFEIEKYDSLLGEAFVWVDVPDLKPGAQTSFFVYYGNAKAPALPAAGTSGGGSAFDADTMLAYHFAGHGVPARDSSVFGNHAQTLGQSSDGSLIGPGLRLDGATPVTIPGAPSLAWTDGGPMTWSAWVKPAEATQGDSVLYSRGDAINGFVIGFANGAPYIEVARNGMVQRTGATPSLAANSWHHLAVVADSQAIALYLDGTPVGSVASALPALSEPAQIGQAGVVAPQLPPAGTTDPGTPVVVQPVAAAAFVGEMDELEIAKVARPAGFLKVAALGQGPDGARLLKLGQDEETSSWSGGYFGVILHSVTLDGWVVIGILMVMALISWVVMVEKARYLSRIEKANNTFLERFRALSGDMLPKGAVEEHPVGSMGGRLGAQERKAFETSPLYRIYRTSAVEMRGRLGNGVLSAESMAAIRASLDSVQVRETQAMNRLMVLLTIAISGGPFLGLLGTVVGVMITFAAIAASGDVNVNAIAPGIAAALVATVAGLGVAIPALFGYNWLLIRVKNSSATMNVFVDELITKLAEAARHRTDTVPASAE